MNDPNHEVRAVRRLAEELRAEPVPDLDWARMEARLARELAGRPAVVPFPARARRRWLPVAFGLAAAAAFALFVALSQHGAAPSPVASGPVDARALPTIASELGPAHPVAALAEGASLASDEEPLRFTLPDVVSWELAPHGRLSVRSTGVPHVVVLEEGSLSAEVVPEREVVESFVVLAGGTRVAVHGTSFTVTRRGTEVAVDVRHGSVWVGPEAGRGTAEGQLLVGPARGSFGLDGRALYARAEAPPPSEPPQVAAQAPAAETSEPVETSAPLAMASTSSTSRSPTSASAPPATTASAAPEATTTTPPQAATLTAAAVRSALSSCLGSSPASDSAPSVVVHTTVSVHADASGRIVSVQFVPPLKPELQSCAYGVLGKQLEGSTVSFSMSFVPGR